jgi:hypothetical protein
LTCRKSFGGKQEKILLESVRKLQTAGLSAKIPHRVIDVDPTAQVE